MIATPFLASAHTDIINPSGNHDLVALPAVVSEHSQSEELSFKGLQCGNGTAISDLLARHRILTAMRPHTTAMRVQCDMQPTAMRVHWQFKIQNSQIQNYRIPAASVPTSENYCGYKKVCELSV